MHALDTAKQYTQLELEQNFKAMVFTQLQVPVQLLGKAKAFTDLLNCAQLRETRRKGCDFRVDPVVQTKISAEFAPQWEESRPNGPGCDPVCTQAPEQDLALVAG